MNTKNTKKAYWILSGDRDAVCGTWQRVVTTERGIKARLTRERCGGDRWARALTDIYLCADGASIAGHDALTGHNVQAPHEARVDLPDADRVAYERACRGEVEAEG